METSCLFCLEPVTKEPLHNPIGCPCKIAAHKTCLHQWFEQRQVMECPICHTVAVPNRAMREDVQVVYVNITEQQELQRRLTSQEKAAAFCCCMILGWSLGLTILELVFR